MITPFKLGNKILGSYKTTLTTNDIIKSDKDKCLHQVVEETFKELKNYDKNNDFNFSLVHINVQEANDLFIKYNVEVIIEFIPNQEMIQELKEVIERLAIGL